MAANPSNTLQGTASTLCTDRRRRRVARERASEHLVKRTDSTFSAPSFLPSSLPSRPPLLPSLQSCPLHRGCMLCTAISMSFLDGDDSIGRLYCTLPPHSKPASLSLSSAATPGSISDTFSRFARSQRWIWREQGRGKFWGRTGGGGVIPKVLDWKQLRTAVHGHQ